MEPRVAVYIFDEALPEPPLLARDDCGAVMDFRGVVRSEENGATITGLHYEAYRPMAEHEIERIARELLEEHLCRDIYVAHRTGFVAAGEASIIVRIASPHRGEAISFLAQFMDRLKLDVPIWKRTSPSAAPKS